MPTLVSAIASCIARMAGFTNESRIMTMKVSKGLEFPVVALWGVGRMPSAGEDAQEAARVFFCVAATRVTQTLIIGLGGDGDLGGN